MNIERKLAQQNHQLYFEAGVPCIRGHLSKRYVSTGGCVACMKEKSDTDNYREIQKRYYQKSKLRRIATSLAWKRSHPKERLGYRLKQYGITVDEYDKMILKQNSKCSICQETLLRDRSTVVDHCHDSGKVRGILCSNCNCAIGHLKNSHILATSAANYLRGFF